MRMTVSDYRVLRRACTLLRSVNSGTMRLSAPESYAGVVDPGDYTLSLGDFHRLKVISDEINGRIETLEEIQTL